MFNSLWQRAKIWGIVYRPLLADIQLEVSVVLDIMKYDSRIYLDNQRIPPKHNRCSQVYVERIMGIAHMNRKPGINTMDG